MRPKQEQLPIHSMKSTLARRDYKPFVPGPNPELPEFIHRHSTPYDPKTDRYDVPAFSRDIVVDKAHPPKAIYDMHTYWSKKHWAAIREYIRHYLPEKFYPKGTGLVLDCFSGSGMTGVAAMMENRPCVLIDASPAAAFISYCYTHPADPDRLQEAYDRMMVEPYSEDLQKKLKKITGEDIQNLQQELDWLYATRCDRCGGPAKTEYVVYSERYQCPYCNVLVPLYDCPEIEAPKKARYCPHCLAKNHAEAHQDFVISTRSKKAAAVPVKIVYRCAGTCKPKRGERRHTEDQRTRAGRVFLEHDLGKIDKIEAVALPHQYPARRMMDVDSDSKPWGVKWRAGSANFRTIAELYSKRNLWALAAWKAAAIRTQKELGPLHISLTVPAITCSRMLRETKRAVQTGTYYIPPVSRHINLTNAIEYGQKVILDGQSCLTDAVQEAGVLVSTISVNRAKLTPMSLDYVFTDPPYVHKVQYGELNFVWESWLGFDGDWLTDEIIVNPYRKKSLDDWDHDMREALERCFVALKPGRWLSLCYHDTEPGTWSRVQDMLLDTGFEIHSVTVLDPKQKSSNQNTGEKVVKADLVLNCRKPGRGERRGHEDAESELVSHRVRDILIETLSKASGQTRDKLWDAILKRLLTRGQMAQHRFDDILAEVAFLSESGRWFLKEEFEQLSQSDIDNEEVAGAALERFTRLRSESVPVQFAAQIALEAPQLGAADVDEREIENYIGTYLIDDSLAAKKFKLSGRVKGIEFYDCLFFYLTRYLKGRSGGKIPRRNLAEFLEEYLVRFKDGDKWLYRPPDPAESQSLKKSRQTGLGRRIKQYCSFLRGEGDLPKEKLPDARTMMAWLKHCATFGLADEGVLLFEKGGLAGQLQQIGADERYDAEDYYSRCKRKASKAPTGDAESEVDEGEAEEEEE